MTKLKQCKCNSKSYNHAFSVYNYYFSMHYNTKWLALGPLKMRSNSQSDASVTSS